MYNYNTLIFILLITCSLHYTTSQGSSGSSSIAPPVVSGPTVTTMYGNVFGRTTTTQTVDGTPKELTSFLGIPYAKPPINELRFKLPEQPDAWNGTFDATQGGHSCFIQGMALNAEQTNPFDPSFTYTQSENCLVLNVYLPGSFVSRMDSPKPVMVFIHGGAYYLGSGNDFDGTILASNQDVILVIINYRLGIFGFASTVDGVIPGNMGMHDQHAALQWVQDNIVQFGGDPQKVCVYSLYYMKYIKYNIIDQIGISLTEIHEL